MSLPMPDSIASDAFKSAKWMELTDGRSFRTSDIPALVLLVQWHAIVDKCIDDLYYADGLHVAYSNDVGDIKAFPQIETLKKASAEIRQLNKQLGIADSDEGRPKAEVTKLAIIQGRYKERMPGA